MTGSAGGVSDVTTGSAGAAAASSAFCSFSRRKTSSGERSIVTGSRVAFECRVRGVFTMPAILQLISVYATANFDLGRALCREKGNGVVSCLHALKEVQEHFPPTAHG